MLPPSRLPRPSSQSSSRTVSSSSSKTDPESPPIYVLEHGQWKEPTLEEALAATIPFADPDEKSKAEFGMGFTDSNGRIWRYSRQENDDMGVVPADIMAELLTPELSSIDLSSDSEVDFDSDMESRLTIKLPRSRRDSGSATDRNTRPATTTQHRKSTKAATAPSEKGRSSSSTSSSRSRKRKATEASEVPPPTTSSRPSRRKSDEENILPVITESDDEPEIEEEEHVFVRETTPTCDTSPPRKVRPPNSGGSSPLKPKSVTTFSPYQCQMPGCCFSASSPQHIKHHYETYQHGRMQTRQVGQQTTG